MNRNIFIIVGLIVVVGVGAYLLSRGDGGEQAPTIQPTPTATPTPSPSPQAPTSATPTPEPQQTITPAPKPIVKEFHIIAKQYTFEPNTITVDKGDRVRLHVKSDDVTHGISIPDFGVIEIIKVGQPITVEFIASKAGVFGMFCSEYCGAGHPNMKGTLIVR